MADELLDVRGLKCPLPILRAQKKLNSMDANATLEILTTDPGSVADFETFCRITGNMLVESRQEEVFFGFIIRHTS